MKKYLIIFCSLFCMTAFAKTMTPVGQWIQVSDKTGQPHSYIHIYSKKGVLYGKITKAFPEAGEPFKKYCDLCKGNLYNAPIVGLKIMNGFVQTDGNVWSRGTILDPMSGKIYKCKLTLENDGKQLKVRGYIGVPLFGRTQIWERKK